MEDTKVLKTTGPLRVDPVTGAMLTKVGPESAAAYIAGLRLAETGGTIAFGGLPADGNTVTIGDETYTFLDSLLGADNEVHIETTRDATMANLVTAINVNAPDTTPVYPDQGLTATLVVVAGADNDSLTLEPSVRGASGNTTLSRVGANITVVSLSGGADFNSATQLAIETLLTANEVLLASLQTLLTAGLWRVPVGTGINAAEVTSHTALDTAEKMDGFTAGSWVQVTGHDTAVYLGSDTDDATSKTAAEAHGVWSPAGVPIQFKLDADLTSLHIDAETGGAYSAFQVS